MLLLSCGRIIIAFVAVFGTHPLHIYASLAAHGVFGALVCASLAPRTNPDSHDFSGSSLCPILAPFSLLPVGWPVGQQRFVHRYLSTCKPPRGRLFAIAVHRLSIRCKPNSSYFGCPCAKPLVFAVRRLSTWCKTQLILPWVPLCERAVVVNARHLWHD